MKAKNKPYPGADPIPGWHCPWGCPWLSDVLTVADRYDHCIDEHLAELKKASAQTLNLIVSPR